MFKMPRHPRQPASPRVLRLRFAARGKGGMGICPKAWWTSDAGGAKIGAC
jgi:hypothetical protein